MATLSQQDKVAHSTTLSTLGRDRYIPESYYPPGSQAPPMRGYAREPQYGRSQPSLDYLHRRRQELISQLEERKVISPPPFPASPTLSHPFPSDYPPEYGEENSKAFGKGREPDYSPWSCDTIGSYIGTKDAKPKDVMAPGSMEMMASVERHMLAKYLMELTLLDYTMVHYRPSEVAAASLCLSQLLLGGLPWTSITRHDEAHLKPIMQHIAKNVVVSEGNTNVQSISTRRSR